MLLPVEAQRDLDRAKAKRRHALNPEVAPVTYELHRRRRGNPLERLMEANRIGPRECRAALEIQSGANLEMSGLAQQAMDYAAPRVDISRRASYGLPASIDQAAVLKRYLAWAKVCRKRGWSLGRLQEVIVDGDSFDAVERRWRIARGSLVNDVLAALTVYVQMAGWGREDD